MLNIGVYVMAIIGGGGVWHSWIGSIQLFLMYGLGFFVGRAFDAGYL